MMWKDSVAGGRSLALLVAREDARRARSRWRPAVPATRNS